MHVDVCNYDGHSYREMSLGLLSLWFCPTFRSTTRSHANRVIDLAQRLPSKWVPVTLGLSQGGWHQEIESRGHFHAQPTSYSPDIRHRQQQQQQQQHNPTQTEWVRHGCTPRLLPRERT
ncbi:hypothetical protein OOU_Y34scaffold00577g1 [Pyricularia oryzae Y34]|uniref:Uncharacterized protein n=2 Tax=Pyricularia oryzae TaxID=318829 RepID=A0AA97NX50_PYRO3|nr:hypothetical protein OOU_Y34scaffold00577g1 [Pyricularia oryzae Y34]